MAKIKINGDSSGYVEIAAPNAAHNNTLELGPGTKILTDKNTHTGNIGIGTDNPQANLHIFEGTGSTRAPAASGNNLVIDSNSEVGMSLLFGTDANTAYGNIYWGNSTDGPSDGRITYFGSTYATAADRQAMVFRTANTERLRITSAGNVSIGADNPDIYGYGGKILTVSDSSTYTNLILASSDATNSGISFGGQTFRRAQIQGGSGSDSDLIFLTNSSNSGISVTEKLRITSSGEVNVGGSNMNNTAYAFQVSRDLGTPSASGTSIARFRNANSTYSQDLYLSFNNSKDIMWAGGSGNGGMTWNMGTRGYVWQIGGSEKVRISSGGLAINKTSAADTELEILQSADPTLRLYDTRNAAYKADFMMAGSAPLIRNNNTTASNRTLTVQKGTTDHLVIEGNGAVRKPLSPSFFSRPAGGYNLSSGGNSPIGGTWSNVHNIGSHFSNGTFTAPVAGTYQFSWSVFNQSETTRIDAYILVNGTNVMREEINGYPSTAANKNSSVHGCYYLSANDNVTFGVYSAAGTQIYSNASPWTYACGFLVG